MWTVVSLICVILPAITTLQCGTPGVPANSYFNTFKVAYEEGETVRISCKQPFEKVTDEKDGIQICVLGVWKGTPPLCLENVAQGTIWFGSDNSSHFEGKYIHKLTNVFEKVFIDVPLTKSTNKALVVFRGSISAVNRNGDNVPLLQSVYSHDFKQFHSCPLLKGHFQCVAKNPFTYVKVEVTLVNRTIDLSNDRIEIILKLEENGLFVADYTSAECGTPATPLHGTVTVADTNAVYQCKQGYQLKGLITKKCESSRNDGLLWPPGNPLCLETPGGHLGIPERSNNLNLGIVAGLIAAGCFVLAFLIFAMYWLYRLRKYRNVNKPASIPMVSTTTRARGYSGLDPADALSNMPFNHRYPPGVEYPFLVGNLYSVR